MAKKDVALLMMLAALKRELRANTYALLVNSGRGEVKDVIFTMDTSDANEQDALKKGGVFESIETNTNGVE